MSDLFKLTRNDFVKGAATAVIAGVVVALYGVVTTPTFDLFAVDWSGVLHLAINAAAGAFVGYIGKNFISDKNGAVLGTFGGSQ